VINISQQQVLDYLRRYPGEKFSAKELQFWLGLNKSIYPNLKGLAKDKLSGVKWDIRISNDSKRKKEFIYYYWET